MGYPSGSHAVTAWTALPWLVPGHAVTQHAASGRERGRAAPGMSWEGVPARPRRDPGEAPTRLRARTLDLTL